MSKGYTPSHNGQNPIASDAHVDDYVSRLNPRPKLDEQQVPLSFGEMVEIISAFGSEVLALYSQLESGEKSHDYETVKKIVDLKKQLKEGVKQILSDYDTELAHRNAPKVSIETAREYTAQSHITTQE